MHENMVIMTTNPSVMAMISLTKQEAKGHFQHWLVVTEKVVNDIGGTEGQIVGQENVQEGEKVRDAEMQDQKQDAAHVIPDCDVV